MRQGNNKTEFIVNVLEKLENQKKSGQKALAKQVAENPTIQTTGEILLGWPAAASAQSLCYCWTMNFTSYIAGFPGFFESLTLNSKTKSQLVMAIKSVHALTFRKKGEEMLQFTSLPKLENKPYLSQKHIQ